MKKSSLIILSAFLLFSCGYYKNKVLSNHLESVKNSSSSEKEVEEIALLHEFIVENAISFESVVHTSSKKSIYYPDFFQVKDIESIDIDFYVSENDTVHLKKWKPKDIENFFYLYNE